MVKNLAWNGRDPGLIPGLARCPGEGNGYQLQYSCLEDSMDRGTWRATVHGVAKSWPLLSNFHTRTQDSAPGPLLTLYPFLIQSHPLAVVSLSAVDRQTPGSYFHKHLLVWAPDLCMYSAAYNLSPWIIPRCLPTQQTKSKIKSFPGKPVLLSDGYHSPSM